MGRHQASLSNRAMEVCESKLSRRNGDFYLRIVVQKEVVVPNPELTDKTVIIACDVGEV